MTDNRREQIEQKFPTHDDIQKRAHEIYLARGGRDGQDIDDWLFAEDQLRREHDERVGTQTTTFVAGPGGVAETEPTDRDLGIAEEERTKVRASEKLREDRTVPSIKSVAVGQQRSN